LHVSYLGANHIYISSVDWNNYVFLLYKAPVSSFTPGLLEKVIVLSHQREISYLNSSGFSGNFANILMHNHLCINKSMELFDIRTHIEQLKNMSIYKRYTDFLDNSNINGIYTTCHLGGNYPSTFPKFDRVEKQFIEAQGNFSSNDFRNLNLQVRVATLENLEILTLGKPYSKELAFSLARESFLKDFRGSLNIDNTPSFSKIFASNYSDYSDSSDSDSSSVSGYSSIDSTSSWSSQLSSRRSDSD